MLNIRGGNCSLSGLLLLWQQAAHCHHSRPHWLTISLSDYYEAKDKCFQSVFCNVMCFFYPSDRKLCIKARLTGALQVTMNVIKNNTAFFKVLQPALQVLKLYSANCKSIAMFSLYSTFSNCKWITFFFQPTDIKHCKGNATFQRYLLLSSLLLGVKSGKTYFQQLVKKKRNNRLDFQVLSQVQWLWAYFPEQLLVIEPNKINSQVFVNTETNRN